MPTDSWTTIADFVADENVTAAKLQAILNNLQALFQGLKGDASVDADIKQAIKTGTLAARPAASQAGRFYYATDVRTMFVDTGTAWEHAGGPGVFDSFDRANVEPMSAADSGHTWTENEGDIDINGFLAAQAITLVGSRAHMTMETGGLIRTLNAQALIVTGAVAASVNVGIVLKRTAADLLYVHISPLGLRLVQNAAQLATSAYTPTATSTYILQVSMIGSQVTAMLHEGSNFRVAMSHGSKTDIQDFAPTATSCGIMFGSTQDDIRSLGMKFN